MMQTEQKSLAFFFMRGMSLKLWKKIGIFDREVMVYNGLASHFKKLYLVTYGDNTELDYQKYLNPNIEILLNRKNMNATLYSFIAPVMHADKLRNCDAFRTDQMDGTWTALLAKLFLRKKLIVRTGYTWSKFIKRKNVFVKTLVRLIESFAYKYCDFAITAAEDDKKYVEKKHPAVKNKIAVIPNYVNTDTFRPQLTKKYADRIIFVGRLARQKNLINLIRALSGTPYGLDVVGVGNEKDKIIKAAHESHIDVKFLGIIQNNDLPAVLNKYRIFVLPSFYEGMPKALLEAMSCGLACVGTNVAGTKEVITHGINGLLAGTDCDSLHNAIRQLVNNYVRLEKLGEAARQLIVEKYSLKNNLQKEIKIYDSIFNKNI